MKLDKLTRKMTEALSSSANLCETRGNAEQTEIHLLYSILTQKEGMVELLFPRLNLKLERFIHLTEESLKTLPKTSGSITERHPSRELIQLLKKADGIRTELKDEYLSTDH